ncbi:VWA domain-containing protein [Marinobacter lacisalsi]|uniref:VWA domain-containing protein n=1 Tax=Marinobacter lacisalsi TaxID=475979 RepID=A0ABV8QE23_9GAMM
MSDFQFLRPAWLLLLLAAPLLYYLLRSLGQGDSRWQQVIPPALLKPLLPAGGGRGHSARWQRLLAPVLLIVAALAMAGPSFRTAPSPLQQQDDSLVVVLDLSLSMLARDLEPDRLTRAIRKIRDLLAAREGAYTGLVVYAGDGHVVTPLTDDRRTVEGLLSAIDPVIMPAPGNRADLGVARAVELLEQGAPGRGRILLITDGLNPRYASNIRNRLADTTWQLDGLLVGTESGAPIPVPERGFLRDGDQVIITRASMAELESTARAMGGEALPMTTSNGDIRQLQLRAEDHDQWQRSEEERTTTRRQDDGYWLLWLALPLALVGWRRGSLTLVAFSLVWMPADPARAVEWSDLWQTPEQRAPQLIDEDPARAASKLTDPLWRGTALYRDGQYESAANAFANSDSPAAHYNRGNALARAGMPEAALDAWQTALEKNPDHEAARQNRDIVRDFLERQKQQQKQQQQQSGRSDQQKGQEGRQNQPSPGEQPGQQDSPGNQQGGSDQGGQPGQNGEQRESGQGTPDEPAESQQQAGQGNNDNADPGQQSGAQAGLADGEGSDALSQSQQQWLRRIPDNPGGLLRRKFMQQSRSRTIQSDENDTPW